MKRVNHHLPKNTLTLSIIALLHSHLKDFGPSFLNERCTITSTNSIKPFHLCSSVKKNPNRNFHVLIPSMKMKSLQLKTAFRTIIKNKDPLYFGNVQR